MTPLAVPLMPSDLLAVTSSLNMGTGKDFTDKANLSSFGYHGYGTEC